MSLTASPVSPILELMAYPGGKNGAGVYQTLINLMPPHDVYIEPFLGGGAVMQAKRPARLNIGLDLSAAAVKKMIDRLSPKMPSGSAGSIFETAEAAGSSTEFRIEQGNALDFLANYPVKGQELIYCDPPYMRGTRRSSKDLYEFEMTDQQHRHLVGLLVEMPCRVMISGYWSKLYTQNLDNWNYISFQTMTRGGRPAQEFVWFNFPKPLELHDYKYLGRDYRERERIKRKKARWAARLAKMPILEKQALLAAMTEAQAE